MIVVSQPQQGFAFCYKSMINFETMVVGDSALFTENNLKLMDGMEFEFVMVIDSR